MIQFNDQLQILQGEDKDVLLYLFDDTTNQPINLVDCQTILADLFVGNKKVYSYMLDPTDGFGTLELDTVFKQVLHLKMERDQTKTFDPGAVKAVVLYRFNSIVFPFGFKHKEVTYQIGRIQAGIMKDLNT